MRIRSLKWTVFGLFLALLFLGRCFGIEWRDPPAGHPPQMSSKVDYDPKISHPLFVRPQKEPPHLKLTAKCFSTSFGDKHRVEFCEARSVDTNGVDLFICHHSEAFDDSLLVRIRNGEFTCQYWTYYRDAGPKRLTWTTKRQKLTLDKKVYRKGDEIKGRIDIRVLDELLSPKYPYRRPRPITVNGVFKTTVE
jgi:hypothetical protein